MNELLQVKDLTINLNTPRGACVAVDRVSFRLNSGTTTALVGESGCGKSLSALSLLGLLPPPATVTTGQILFQEQDLLKTPAKDWQKLRGRHLAMIFQEPMTSLNPLLRIGDQLTEGLRIHNGLSRRDALQEAAELLNLVGISAPAKRLAAYPHQLSGGMRQRVMIAMALALHPQLLIADEPTTALDVTIQAQILYLLRDLQNRLGTAILLITHDLGVVASMAEEVLVMYLGRIVERAQTGDLFRRPQHPYTAGLLGSMPGSAQGQARLTPISGNVPNPWDRPAGCPFQARCPRYQEQCSRAEPTLREVPGGGQVACWFPLALSEVAAND